MKRTVINQAHPWNIYKARRDSLKRHLSSMSNQRLANEFFAHSVGRDECPERRKDIIDALLRAFDIRWRKAWREEFGFEFDDVRDNEKFLEHIKAGRFGKNEKEEETFGERGKIEDGQAAAKEAS